MRGDGGGAILQVRGGRRVVTCWGGEHAELRVGRQLARAQAGLAGRGGDGEAWPESLQLVGLNDRADQVLAGLLVTVICLGCCDCVAVVILGLLRHFI